MELGSLIWFSSREHPFAVRDRHCLDLECSCTDARLTFTEVDLGGKALDEPLTFEICINLRNGRERRPPKRCAGIQTLVREFLVRFPEQRFQEMISRRQEQRAVKRRLETYTPDVSKMGELLCYSDVIHEEGGVSHNGRRFSFFFSHDGRDYLIEDHYCPRPTCDCRTVHVEFWERIELRGRSPCVDVMQRLMAAFTLEGELERIQFCHEDLLTAEDLCRAWREHCGHQLEEFRRRYQEIKSIGQRSLALQPAPAEVDDHADQPLQESADTSAMGARAGRNAPCPCGSGQKFKRCCGRREGRG
jgi:hypothetical protein